MYRSISHQVLTKIVSSKSKNLKIIHILIHLASPTHPLPHLPPKHPILPIEPNPSYLFYCYLK